MDFWRGPCREVNVVRARKMTFKKYEETPIGVRLVTAGTAACMADLVTFPLDTAKVLLQVQGEGKSGKKDFLYRGVFSTIATVARQQGPSRLYQGLIAGLQRQMCFASVRIGLYETFKEFYQQNITGKGNPGGVLDILTRISAGFTTGALAVVIAQPTDIVKVRYQALTDKSQKYKSTFHAYTSIYRNEGVRGLWKGMYPNIVRSAIVNVSEIVCYDLVKGAILKHKLMGDNTMCHFTSAVVAGFFTTVVSSPVDVIKTRYMNSPPGQYSSAINCAIKTAKLEGLTAFYKGFMPSFYRLVAWNIVMWVSYEKLKVLVIYMYNR